MYRQVMMCLLCALTFTAHAVDDDAALWQALKDGGHVALIRHALAPGTGDPPEFKVDDCATQRNLSAEGRAQARAIGERFRIHGVTDVVVYSSQWCRCLDTANELRLGPVTPFPALNSFVQDRSREPAQTAAVRKLIRAHDGKRTLVLVTHQVNISALTDAYSASGEIIVVRMDGEQIEVVGRID